MCDRVISIVTAKAKAHHLEECHVGCLWSFVFHTTIELHNSVQQNDFEELFSSIIDAGEACLLHSSFGSAPQNMSISFTLSMLHKFFLKPFYSKLIFIWPQTHIKKQFSASVPHARFVKMF